jgi:hypothetical protein
MNDDTTDHPSLQPIIKLNRDLMTALMREHPGGVTDNEARFLVDTYYAIQKARIRSSNQTKGLDRDAVKTGTEAEPHTALDRFVSDFSIHEENVKRILGWYVESHPMAWFFEATLGVGPVLAAGLLAHIDISMCPTAGHIWRFAGLDPTVSWDKGQKRPWNTGLKTICWKIGDSFVKLSGRQDSYYSQVYRNRKVYEWKRNISGELRDEATRSMDRKKYGKSTDQWAWYTGACDPAKVAEHLESGTTPTAANSKGEIGFPMLSPGHIDARARRYAVKLFLSHLHECWFRDHFDKEPPAPFPIAHLGHAHLLRPPQIASREMAA